jgi:hypothetical protein
MCGFVLCELIELVRSPGELDPISPDAVRGQTFLFYAEPSPTGLATLRPDALPRLLAGRLQNLVKSNHLPTLTSRWSVSTSSALRRIPNASSSETSSSPRRSTSPSFSMCSTNGTIGVGTTTFSGGLTETQWCRRDGQSYRGRGGAEVGGLSVPRWDRALPWRG